MGKTFIFGHKNPDTDTICSSIAYEDLKKKLGADVEAVKLGDVNKETQFALDYFKFDAPDYLPTLEPGTEVILVDHNEFQQSSEGIEEARILEVIDHHRIANFETKEPVFFRAEPVGCTATIIKKMYKENQVDLPENIAGLLLSAIISDSLLLKSPTCTKEDVDAAYDLARIAGVNLEEYGLEMLKAGADLSDKTASQLITMDAKEFAMHGAKVEIAQVNTVDVEATYAIKEELEAEINKVISEKGLDLFVFVVTDIINNDSDALALGNAADKFETAFHVNLNDNRAFLKDVVSRKKQIVTNLTDAFA